MTSAGIVRTGAVVSTTVIVWSRLELLPQADFVVVTAPLTRETQGMIDERALLDALVELSPAPDERGEKVGTLPGKDEEVRRAVSADEPVSLDLAA